MIAWTQLVGETLFTYSDPERKQELTFAVDRLAKAVEHIAPVQVPVDPEIVQLYLEQRGIEEHRLRKLTPAALNTPILLVEYTGGTHLLVDGHHRFVYAGRLGREWILARCVPESLWREFLVAGLPTLGEDMLRTMRSGL